MELNAGSINIMGPLAAIRADIDAAEKYHIDLAGI
jgi:hypothetical protein